MLRIIPLPYKLLAIVAAFIGVFAFGYMKGSANAETELAKFSAKASAQVAELEKKNSKISTKVITEYVDRVNTIKEKEYVYRDIVKNDVPNQFTVSNGWVHTHDASATSGDADSTRASDASSSGIEDTAALLGIIKNYSICQSNAIQLTELQRWITENKAAVDAITEEKKK